jgi:hypothetical protein
MEVKPKDILTEKRVKRVAVDMTKLKADGLAMAASYMQGLQAAIKVYEQQAAASNQ